MPVGSTKWKFIFPSSKERRSPQMTFPAWPKSLNAFWPSSASMNKSPNHSNGNLPAQTSVNCCKKYLAQRHSPWPLKRKIRHRIYAPEHLVSFEQRSMLRVERHPEVFGELEAAL